MTHAENRRALNDGHALAPANRRRNLGSVRAVVHQQQVELSRSESRGGRATHIARRPDGELAKTVRKLSSRVSDVRR